MSKNIEKAAEHLNAALSELCKEEERPSAPRREHEAVSSRGFEPHASSSVISTAQKLIQRATTSGSFLNPNRKIKKQERLRSVTEPPKKKEKKEKYEEVHFFFKLLRALEDDDEAALTVNDDTILARGVIIATSVDSESMIREKIHKLLVKDLPTIGKWDFEFVKVERKAVVNMQVGDGLEFDFKMIKKIAGQGALYLKIKDFYKFVYKDSDSDPDNKKLPKVLTEDSDKEKENIVDLTTKDNDENVNDEARNATTESENNAKSPPAEEKKVSIPPQEHHYQELEEGPYVCIIKEAKTKSFVSDVEILKFFQSKIHKGRPLEVESPDTLLEGETNDISVDRENIVKTTMDELEYVEDFSLTFNVEFIAEEVLDHGGPRKEWMDLTNKRMYEIYFESGLRELLWPDYYFVGAMIGITLLQNGPIPAIPENICNLIIGGSDNKCILKLVQGLETVGMASIFKAFPSVLHMLTKPKERAVSVSELRRIFKPEFAAEGSSALVCQKQVYSVFNKYVREVAAGMRKVEIQEGKQTSLTTSDILQFATGSSTKPIFGYTSPPTLIMPLPLENLNEHTNTILPSFYPTTNTCSNGLVVPRPTHQWKLPDEKRLFEIYDEAFSSKYFGKR